MGCGDYVELITYLLFLKRADERTKAPCNQKSPAPEKYRWPALLKKDGDELFVSYRLSLEGLAKEKGLRGLIFNKSQNKFQGPATLRRLIDDLIDKENWSVMSAEVKGDAYEGLLEKNAQDVKGGAGQCFTPWPLITGIVDVSCRSRGSRTATLPAAPAGSFWQHTTLSSRPIPT